MKQVFALYPGSIPAHDPEEEVLRGSESRRFKIAASRACDQRRFFRCKRGACRLGAGVYGAGRYDRCSEWRAGSVRSKAIRRRLPLHGGCLRTRTHVRGRICGNQGVYARLHGFSACPRFIEQTRTVVLSGPCSMGEIMEKGSKGSPGEKKQSHITTASCNRSAPSSRPNVMLVDLTVDNSTDYS